MTQLVQLLNAFGIWLTAHLWAMSIELLVLAGAVYAVIHLLRIKSPAIRHLFWFLVLIKPVVTCLVASPLSPYLLLPQEAIRPDMTARALPRVPYPVGMGAPISRATAFLDPATTTTPSTLPELMSPPARQALNGHGIVALIWSLLSAAFLVRLFLGFAYVAFLRQTAELQRTGALADAVIDASGALNSRRRVRVSVSAVSHGPVLAGIFRPVILLPTALAAELSSRQIKFILAHELAHVRRWDNLSLLLQRIAEVVLFFHPVVWFCGGVMRREAEAACDDVVLSAYDRSTEYADSLTRVAEMRFGFTRRLLVNTFAAAESNLANRVYQILAGKRTRTSVRLIAISMVTLGAVAVFGLPGALAPQANTAAVVKEMTEVVVPGAVQAETIDAPAATAPPENLQAMIDAAVSGGVVMVPKGIYTEPITISRPLTLKGESTARESILDITSDEPGIKITSEGPVIIDGLTVRYQRKTSDRTVLPSCAVAAKDNSTTIENCHFIAKGSGKRSPCAISAHGFCNTQVSNCRFEGFEFTIQYADGAKGSVADCVITDPGHCGITVGNDCTVNIERNIVTGSRHHGIRCTGGTLNVRGNLVIGNKNRGVYLGNRSAHGEIVNNLIMENATGISGFSRSSVSIRNNLVLNSDYAGLDLRDSCNLVIENNIFMANTKGIVVYKEIGKSRFTLNGNTFWKNGKDTLDVERPANSIIAEPKFTAPDAGDFSLPKGRLSSENQGLLDHTPIKQLWLKYQEQREAN